MIVNILYAVAQNQLFCVDVRYIKKLILLPELVPWSGAPNDVAGVLNYGGKIIPVFDLALLMNVARLNPYTIETIVMICTNEKDEIGLIVDSVRGQDSISDDVLNADNKIKGDNTYLQSIITLNNTVIMAPAINKIISREINLESRDKHYE